MITRFSLLSVFIFTSVFVSLARPELARACEGCSQVTWQQLCAQKMVRAGYSGSVGSFCQPINSGSALQCVSGLVDHRYNNITLDVMNGCSWATECGVTALRSLFRNRYSVTGAFLRTVGGTNSWGQAQCFATVFNRGYQNLTSYNIRGLCP